MQHSCAAVEAVKALLLDPRWQHHVDTKSAPVPQTPGVHPTPPAQDASAVVDAGHDTSGDHVSTCTSVDLEQYNKLLAALHKEEQQQSHIEPGKTFQQAVAAVDQALCELEECKHTAVVTLLACLLVDLQVPLGPGVVTLLQALRVSITERSPTCVALAQLTRAALAHAAGLGGTHEQPQAAPVTQQGGVGNAPVTDATADALQQGPVAHAMTDDEEDDSTETASTIEDATYGA